MEALVKNKHFLDLFKATPLSQIGIEALVYRVVYFTSYTLLFSYYGFLMNLVIFFFIDGKRTKQRKNNKNYKHIEKHVEKYLCDNIK